MSPSRRLRALADVMMLHDQHRRELDGALIMVSGSIGDIRLHHGELVVVTRKQASAQLLRRLLGAGILDVTRDGSIKISRLPRPDESVTLRDWLGFSVRRT
ncbi:hypothetical protein ACE102_03145 [Bradyrhizobium sp. vgs-9]|uniref:hypothetical protein n=1 Tax=Bradyrhizobium sp. vgs-9 TaxID=208389 RepID=UPI0035D40CE3